jgi:hypothetical protein
MGRLLFRLCITAKYLLQYEKLRVLPYNACHSNPADALLITDS